MATTTTYQCPNCGGRLSFDSSAGKLRCEFCDSLFTAEEVEALYAEKQAKSDASAINDRAIRFIAKAGLNTSSLGDQEKIALSRAYEKAREEGKSDDEVRAAMLAAIGAGPAGTPSGAHASTSGQTAAQASTSAATQVTHRTDLTGDPIQDYIAQSKWDSSETDKLRAFNCPACGAQLLVDQVTAVTSCPYCGNNAVVPGQLSDMLKPDFVIPFKLDKAAAVEALRTYYKGKKLLPNDFTEANHIEEIQGVYVPLWLYSGTGSADATFNGRNIRTWSDSDNNYTETDHFLAERSGTMSFYRVPVDGSTKMPDAHMDAIEPFDYNEMVPFSVGYLPGYLTDRYDQGVKTCEKRAGKRVKNTCVDTLRDTVTGYMEVDLKSAHCNLALNDVAYALLPVWMLHTRYNDEDYLFAMNGQTGRLVGDLPIDNGKVIRRSLMFFIPLFVVMLIVVNFTLGFGL